jgi:hypothetical protein
MFNPLYLILTFHHRYNVREYDNWQIMPLIRGLGSTGKTMITDIIRQTYNANDIGTISNGIEKQFGLSQVRYISPLYYFC